MPRWVIPATIIFWVGALAALVARAVWARLDDLVVLLAISLFLSLAIEPGVNRLSRRGWRRGSATALILFGVVIVFLLFVAAIGTLVGSQIAELLTNTERYISRTVNFLNDTFGFNINAQEAIDAFNDPDGAVQQFIQDQQDDALALSVAALGWLLQLFSVILFTFYLVADGPRLRRAICTRLTPDHQERVLQTWELASTKTGGYLVLPRPAGAAVDVVPLDRVPVGRHGRPDRPGPVGRHRQPVPSRRRHVHRRRAPSGHHVPRFAAQGADRVDRHRPLPADRELLVRPAHHGAHDAAAPGPGVRVGARRGGAARRRRRRTRPPGGSDGPGAGVGAGNSARRRRQPPDHRGRGPRTVVASAGGSASTTTRARRDAAGSGADASRGGRPDRRDDTQWGRRVDPLRRRRRPRRRGHDRLVGR